MLLKLLSTNINQRKLSCANSVIHVFFSFLKTEIETQQRYHHQVPNQ